MNNSKLKNRNPNFEIHRAAIAVFYFLLFGFCFCAQAQTTAFTYQGRLNDGAAPANGVYDLLVTDYSAPTGGSSTAFNLVTNVVVSNGLFTATFDLSELAFPGADRWLEIGVRTNGGGDFTFLAPRQQVTSAPYAIRARHFTGVISNAQLTGAYSGPVTFSNPSNSFSGSFTGNGAGLTNLNAWQLGGNAGTAPGVNFLGTTDNQPLEFLVNNQRTLRLEPGTTIPSIVAGDAGNTSGGAQGVLIGGGHGNRMSVGADYAVIAGGRNNTNTAELATISGGATNETTAPNAVVAGGSRNQVTAPHGVVGGGYYNLNWETNGTIAGGSGNRLYGDYSGSTVGGGINNVIATSQAGTIAGGIQNHILGNSPVATVGGGYQNFVETAGANATIAGGYFNLATAAYASIGGGHYNTNAGSYASIPGGSRNRALGNYSFAAGRRAKANHTGTFVWADSTDADFSSTANDQLLVRATGGVGINTNNPSAALHVGGAPGVDGIRYPDGTLQTTAATTPAMAFSSGSASTPTATASFISAVTTITLTRSSRIFVTSQAALGSSAAGGATGLNLYIAYRPSGGSITTVGGGVFGLTCAQNQRSLFGLSGLTPILPPGVYDVGLAGSSSTGVNWNNNEWSYTTAIAY